MIGPKFRNPTLKNAKAQKEAEAFIQSGYFSQEKS